MQTLLDMDMIEKYLELYEQMAQSKDIEKMRVFGEADKWAFERIAKSSPDMARAWIERLEAINWYNYLSEGEANEIMSKFRNQDGTSGPKWNSTQIASVVEKIGGEMEDEPFYNKCALVVTMNMIYSDHAESLSEVVTAEDMPTLIYKMAVEKLKDPDRRDFVRDYFLD